MFLSPKSTNVFPPVGGTWVPGTDKGQRTAFFCCPGGCQTYMNLGAAITADGAAHATCEPCGFDDDLQLVDWTGKSLK